jgi:hypothetical protein
MNSEYKIWKDIEERFKFFLMLAALCACGYLAWHQFIYIIFALIFGGVAAAMIPLYDLSQERLGDLGNLDESDLREAINQILEAKIIISEYCLNDQASSLEFCDFNQSLGAELKQSEKAYIVRQNERKEQEELKQQRARLRANYVDQRRLEKGLKNGEPPYESSNQCPVDHRIRATENLPKGDSYKGIYYQPGDLDYKSCADWCFKSVEDAEEDGYRMSEKPWYKKRYS